MYITAVGEGYPTHYYPQDVLLDAVERMWGAHIVDREKLRRLHRSVQVEGRHLALPLEAYPQLTDWGRANDAWIEVAREVGERALQDALHRAGRRVEDVHTLVFVTTTGIATPSLDAQLMNRIGLRAGTRRLPLFGLGCAGGAAGLARASELRPPQARGVTVVLSVELCSLTLQQSDLSPANLIATGLFGDGAAAAVLEGEAPAGASEPAARVVDTRSVFYPRTEQMMGWHVSDRGLRLRLSPQIPSMVAERLAPDVDAFLRDQGLRRNQIVHWICHPGGPRVLAAVERALELSPDRLEIPWRVLAQRGNLSSASVLLVLKETLERARPRAGEYGVMMAMGPGFALELVLLQW